MGISFDPIALEILWGRLISIADEAAISLRRAAFSMVVREANDYACVLLDRSGNAVAQSSQSVPGFIGTMPRTVKTMLESVPPASWRPGDILFTNDIWMGTGHLSDFTVVSPIFYRDDIVGFFGSTAHAPDVGGPVFGADAREVFEEGLRIPLAYLQKQGKPNVEILDLIRGNVRTPEQTVGDLFAQVAAGTVAIDRLVALLEEEGLDALAPVADVVISRTESAMRKAVQDLPCGVYHATLETDGVQGICGPLRLCAAVAIDGSHVVVDYAGSSPQVPAGINACLNYTFSCTAYIVKCLLEPDLPNNEGAFRPIVVRAPEASVLNSRFPAAGGARQLTGQYLHGLLLDAFSRIIPTRGMADSGSPKVLPAFYGSLPSGRPYVNVLLPCGGMGARATKDGVSCMAFPSNGGMASVEVLEMTTSLLVRRRQLICDSGGAGTYRGGCGQHLQFEVRGNAPVVFSLFAERLKSPARGRLGGLPGAPAGLERAAGDLAQKGRTVLSPGEIVGIKTAGGGGYGPPGKRRRELVIRDLEDELVSDQAARQIYELAEGRTNAR